MIDSVPWLRDSRWPTVPIKHVARLGTGHTPSRQEPEYWVNCNIPWITLADVWQLRDGRTRVIAETAEKVSALGLANSAAVRHPARSVILSRTASVGFSAIMATDMATSQDFVVWTCGPEILPEFLLHVLRAMEPDLKRLAAGSTHKTIYMPDIQELQTPLPPLAEQRRITDYLDVETDRIDKLSRLRTRQDDLLDQRVEAQLDERLVRGGQRTEVPLAVLTDPRRPIQYGIVLPGPDFPGGVPIIKGGDVAAARMSPELLKRTDPVIEAAYRRSRVKAGDLVIAIRGSVGEVASVPESLTDANLTQDSARIAPHKVDASWLFGVLHTRTVQQRIEARITGATIRGINIGDLRRVLIPTPPIGEQRLLGLRALWWMEYATTMAERLSRSIALLGERRQAVSTAAVTGRHLAWDRGAG